MVDMSAVYQNRGPLNAKMLRGEKVISFSLVGDNPAECIGAIDNSKKAAIYFPGWKCRYYVAKNVPSIIIETIRGESNTEVITIIHSTTHNQFHSTVGDYFVILLGGWVLMLGNTSRDILNLTHKKKYYIIKRRRR